jgi:hypothetical protein
MSSSPDTKLVVQYLYHARAPPPDADFCRDELALRLEEERIEAPFRLTVAPAIAVAAIVIAA